MFFSHAHFEVCGWGMIHLNWKNTSGHSNCELSLHFWESKGFCCSRIYAKNPVKMEVSTSLEPCFFYCWNTPSKSKNNSKGKVFITSHNKKNPNCSNFLCLSHLITMLELELTFFSFILDRFAHYNFIKMCGREIRRSYCLTVTNPKLFYSFNIIFFC